MGPTVRGNAGRQKPRLFLSARRLNCRISISSGSYQGDPLRAVLTRKITLASRAKLDCFFIKMGLRLPYKEAKTRFEGLTGI